MRPIDTLTGIPKSPEIAKVADSTQKQGTVQSQIQLVSFAKEVSERASTVSQSPQVTEAAIDPDSRKKKGNTGGSFSDGAHDDRSDTDEPKPQHPTKGKILDIRGA
ncbi:MAG: hypothetical protein KBI39_00195 [Firmicutes bacterium]|mgnify:CR=1 FL=1|nr:hypothetical protein [Candidatus Fermentithermobacillaceae bacterium]HON86953.1 hypothetical protein [Bacillota bacterium]HRC53197.1 hypothetical protein [Bacillota bacterium]